MPIAAAVLSTTKIQKHRANGAPSAVPQPDIFELNWQIEGGWFYVGCWPAFVGMLAPFVKFACGSHTDNAHTASSPLFLFMFNRILFHEWQAQLQSDTLTNSAIGPAVGIEGRSK
jgi:hypothetical protein